MLKANKSNFFDTSKLIVLNILVYIGLLIRFPSVNENRVLNSTAYYQIYILIVIILINIMIQYCKYIQLSMLIKALNAICAVVYASVIVIGRAYIAKENLSLIWDSNQSILYALLSCISFSILLYFTFLTIYKFISKIQFSSVLLEITGKARLKLWGYIFLCFFILWFPYFIITNPGLAGNDGMHQINELFYQKTFDGYFTLTNHHPLFTTLIQGGLIKLGLILFHSINSGVLINSIFLNILTISCFSFLILTIIDFYGNKLGILTMMFFGLFPIFPLWANALDKTGYFNAILSLFLVSIINIDGGKRNKSSIALLIISGVLLGLIRNDGLIYILAVLIGSLTLKKKRNILISLASVVFLIVIIGKILVFSTKALPTEPMESLAIPMQQISRVVKYNPSSLTNSEKTTLNKFFHYSNMAKVYNPEFADPAKINSRWPYRQFVGTYKARKEKYDNQNFVKNKKKFLLTWIKIGENNKKLYFEAFVGENLFYIYPQNHPTIYFWMPGTSTNTLFVTKMFKNYKLNRPELFSKLVKNILIATNLPVLNLLFISFTWFFIWLIESLVIINTNKLQYLNLVFLGAAIIIVELLSPLSGYLRYSFPLIELVPILGLICFVKIKN
ncbi:DUF6020 family protein [Limosilactobacillus reuteri]|uniref:Glycosyltransferase RgtA/B/C/D-like domain-containing protein n=1 Tax=Limosilactobacillus reuteri TD1 TaxID=1358027 RepID=S5NYM4_LIMRT|nr:DUF6020 family protein [Limosilactobacillus reuteri]AGR65322.1 hypothetical protein N134_07585 [Limosilactobacillus reuteri TD1]MCC4331980.1 DUF6020 family protein [Limosilactobacillus reuteri]MCC4354181.1 DUF6020 family protein [Limosilactobacillus reuteri]